MSPKTPDYIITITDWLEFLIVKVPPLSELSWNLPASCFSHEPYDINKDK